MASAVNFLNSVAYHSVFLTLSPHGFSDSFSSADENLSHNDYDRGSDFSRHRSDKRPGGTPSHDYYAFNGFDDGRNNPLYSLGGGHHHRPKNWARSGLEE